MFGVAPVQLHCFQLTGFTRKKKRELSGIIIDLGGSMLSDVFLDASVTHIICGKPSQSEKFLCGLALGKWILTPEYLTASRLAGRWVEEAPHEWNSDKTCPAGEGEILQLLTAVSRWRLHMSNTGTGAFFRWRVTVLVEDPKQNEIYKRLLQVGGAVLVDVRMPIRSPHLVARDVSHVFVEHAQKDSVQGLLSHGVLCLKPIYIAHFLLMDPGPNPREYLVNIKPAGVVKPTSTRFQTRAPSIAKQVDTQPQTTEQLRTCTRTSLTATANNASVSDEHVSNSHTVSLKPTPGSTPINSTTPRRPITSNSESQVPSPGGGKNSEFLPSPWKPLRQVAPPIHVAPCAIANNATIGDERISNSHTISLKPTPASASTGSTTPRRPITSQAPSSGGEKTHEFSPLPRKALRQVALPTHVVPCVPGLDRVLMEEAAAGGSPVRCCSVRLISLDRGRRDRPGTPPTGRTGTGGMGSGTGRVGGRGGGATGMGPCTGGTGTGTGGAGGGRGSRRDREMGGGGLSGEVSAAGTPVSGRSIPRDVALPGCVVKGDLSRTPSPLAGCAEVLTKPCVGSPLFLGGRGELPVETCGPRPDGHPSASPGTCLGARLQKPVATAFQNTKRRLELTSVTPKRLKLDLPWSRACPGIVGRPLGRNSQVVLPVPRAMTMIFEACIEEARLREALHVLASCTSATRYPQAGSLHTAIDTLLLVSAHAACPAISIISSQQEDYCEQLWQFFCIYYKTKQGCVTVAEAHQTYGVLCHVLSLHPPTKPVLQNLYLSAIRGQETEAHTRPSAWEIINNSLSVAVGAETCPQEQLNHWLLIKFVTAVIETDFAIFQHSLTAGAQPHKAHARRTLCAQIMWPHGQVGKVNMATRQLFRHLVLLTKGGTGDVPQGEMMEVLQSLVAMTAQCCHLEGAETHAHLSPLCDFLARELAYLIKAEVGDSAEPLHQLLTSFKLPWLRLLVSRALLDLYDDRLLGAVPANNSQLNLRTIVRYHFYLLPPVAPQVPSSPHCKTVNSESGRSTSNKKLPLRTIMAENVTVAQKNNKTATANARKAGIVNRQNMKGETALHRACIKNNVLRIRDLLQTPGINVNISDHAGWTPLHEACNHGSIECLIELLKYSPTNTIDSYFTQSKTQHQQQWRRVNMLVTSEEGLTPLHDAVINHQVEAATLLLQHGGRSLLAARTTRGQTPLDLAATDAMRDLLISFSSSSASSSASPTATSHKRHSLMSTEDFHNSSQDSSQSEDSSQFCSQDPAGDLAMPAEERYTQVLLAGGTSPQHCLTFVMLLRHLVGSYMSVRQIQRLKAQLTEPALPCPLDLTDCSQRDAGSASSHVTCVCRHLASTLGDEGTGTFEDDVSVLRRWRHHHANLKAHLERISDGKVTARSVQVQGHSMALLLLGSIS